MFKKSKNKSTETVVEIVKTPKKETSFSVFQVVIFAFIFILMVWIIGFLSLELDGQKQQIRTLYTKVDNIENGGTELLESYIEKIKELQKIDIKEQVQQFGIDIKENIQRVRELMFDKSDLAKVESKIQALEDYNKTYRGINLLTLTSSMLLRDAINRGDSFISELTTLSAIAGDNPSTTEILIKLEPYSKDGIKTLGAIRNSFDNMADTLAFIAKNPKEDSIQGRFLFRIKGLLKVRKIDYSDKEIEENSTTPTSDYIIAKIQKALNNEDLHTAITEYENLNNISQEAFEYGKQWYDEARIKLSIDEIINPLIQQSLEKALHDSQQQSNNATPNKKITPKKKYTLNIQKEEAKDNTTNSSSTQQPSQIKDKEEI